MTVARQESVQVTKTVSTRKIMESEFHRLKMYLTLPEWAEDLAEKICAREGIDTPEIRWRTHKSNYGYRGMCYHDKSKGITITAGKDLILSTQKCLLIHELTHFVLPREDNHGERFYVKMFALCEREGIPIQEAYRFEANYKVTASIVAAKIMASRLDTIVSCSCKERVPML